jgi:hypothetical protein
VASIVPGALGAASQSAAFSGKVCTLLTATQVPHGVTSTCRQAAPDASQSNTTTYVGKWGVSGLQLEVKVSTFASAAARSNGLAEFKQEDSILPQIGVPVAAVSVGTWARESVNPKAASVTVQFVAGGDDCIVFVLGVPGNQDSVYRGETLAAAKAIAAKLI